MHEAPCISPAFVSCHGPPSLKCFVTHWHIKNEQCERSNPAYSRVFSIGVNGKVQKIPFFTKFLATVCFFTLIFPNSTHFCACLRITILKIELSAQSASLHTNFCNNSEYSFIRKIIEKKSYFSCSSSLNVMVAGGLNPQWEGNND